MGAWGVLAFDNDDANDWAYDLAETEDLSLVESAFETVETAADYLEAPDASNALAACEVLARLNGKPGYKNSYTQKVDEWAAIHSLTPSTDLLGRADAVINRSLSDNSELKDLWSESSENGDWLASIEDLRQRLRK